MLIPNFSVIDVFRQRYNKVQGGVELSLALALHFLTWVFCLVAFDYVLQKKKRVKKNVYHCTPSNKNNWSFKILLCNQLERM